MSRLREEEKEGKGHSLRQKQTKHSFYLYLSDALEPVGVAFKGHNGKYLSRVYYTYPGKSFIEVTKNGTDHFTRFLATESDGKLLLKADNGNYLCREEDTGYITAEKNTPDATCQFTVVNQADGTVVLQADNGKYMSRVRILWYLINQYMAVKSDIDVLCKLKLEFQMKEEEI